MTWSVYKICEVNRRVAAIWTPKGIEALFGLCSKYWVHHLASNMKRRLVLSNENILCNLDNWRKKGAIYKEQQREALLILYFEEILLAIYIYSLIFQTPLFDVTRIYSKVCRQLFVRTQEVSAASGQAPCLHGWLSTRFYITKN